jgi:benzoylformate decarboxylase
LKSVSRAVAEAVAHLTTTGHSGALRPMQITVRDATLAVLRDLGMTTLFGNPGSTELPLFRNFPKDFRYVLGLQESIAVAMADGYAQATRNAALVNLHSSVGVGHALGSLFTSYRNQTPLVVVAGQQARSILPFEPFLYAQNPTEFPRPFVKWSCEPARPDDVARAIARAYYIAMEPPCGPTFVSVPVDDWDRPSESIEARHVTAVNPGDPRALEEAARALADARKPALILGAGVARDDAWQDVIQLAERHNASVWVAPFSARNSFPEDHRLFAGFLAPMRPSIVRSLTPHDLLVVLGGPLSLYHVEDTGPHVPAGSRVIQIVDNPAQASWAPTGRSIVANTKWAIRTLLNGPAPRDREPAAPAVRPARLPATELTDAYLCQQIAALRPSNSILVEEAPSTREVMHDYLPIVDKDGFYTCASGGLGYGLPAAVGIALARPDRKVIALLGDGSSLYSIQGLWCAAQLKLPVTFVIVRNRGYEALVRFGTHFGMQETVGTQLPDIDFCALARAQGLNAMRVRDCEGLSAILSEAFTSPDPFLVEVCVK